MAGAQITRFWPKQYQAARTEGRLQFGGELADVASDIRDPVVKLRFLRDVIDRQQRIPRSLNNRLLRFIRRCLLHPHAWVSRATHITQARWRVACNYILAMGFLSLAMMSVVNSYRAQANDSANRQIIASNTIVTSPATSQLERSVTPTVLPTVAESLPTESLGITPNTIWLADRGTNWELYSNGLRVETTYTVNGDPRRFRIYDRDRGLQPTVYSKPTGILFHTSESDLWPLDAGFDKQLRQSSTALLKYAQRESAYNYVIDRFGRVYRIVEDETRANHAGRSIWANGRDIYFDLNSAFVGVSFESRWEGGRTMPITRAQLMAGRNLTNYLRQRFAIAPEMCVTHGLTSVSPKLFLLGYHKDWARGFPFAAFGLPDQYALPPPSITLFGFSYGEDVARVVGDGWPGLHAADLILANEARSNKVTLNELRAQHHERYRKWVSEVHIDEPDAAPAITDACLPTIL